MSLVCWSQDVHGVDVTGHLLIFGSEVEEGGGVEGVSMEGTDEQDDEVKNEI